MGVYGTVCPEMCNSGNCLTSGYFPGENRVYFVSFPSPMLREILLANNHSLRDFNSVFARLKSVLMSE